MNGLIQLAGPDRTVQLFGVRLVGLNAQNAKKLLLTIVFVLLVLGLSYIGRRIARTLKGEQQGRVEFWTKQAINIAAAVLLLIGLISIWFNNPSQLTSAGAFITAGLAVALQRVITAVAGYFVILRGKTFNVGDRIVMGGVRGDVVALGFMQTTIMEMGQPPAEQSDAPSMWVAARQYTGRVVTITNDKIFDQPVYNYTRDFPYIWEEMHFPIPYKADRAVAERIILEATRRHTVKIAEMSEPVLDAFLRHYRARREDVDARVFIRLTDNWIEMAVRFVVEDHDIRRIKDAIARDILEGLDRVGIGLASGTYEVVGMPELRVRLAGPPG